MVGIRLNIPQHSAWLRADPMLITNSCRQGHDQPSMAWMEQSPEIIKDTTVTLGFLQSRLGFLMDIFYSGWEMRQGVEQMCLTMGKMPEKTPLATWASLEVLAEYLRPEIVLYTAVSSMNLEPHRYQPRHSLILGVWKSCSTHTKPQFPYLWGENANSMHATRVPRRSLISRHHCLLPDRHFPSLCKEREKQAIAQDQLFSQIKQIKMGPK